MALKILVSAADKTGLEKFYPLVAAKKAQVVAIGNSAAYLESKGIECERVSAFSSFIAMIDEGLADLLVFNLPKEAKDPEIDRIEWVRFTIIRQAAVSYSSVGVVVDPEDYDAVIAEMTERDGLTDLTKMRLAQKAFYHLSEFDRRIADWFRVLIINEETGFGTAPSSR